MSKTFLAINFGCRVNMAETNQWSQHLINQGFKVTTDNPDLILVNTCSVTKKGEVESLGKIRNLQKKYPQAKIIATGCANLDKIKNLKNIDTIDNKEKETILKKLNSIYTPQIKDKFTLSHRYLLKIQSGCTQFCSYCIVPFKRQQLFSLPIDQAIKSTNQAVKNGYKEVIITGVNLEEYKYGFSNLIEAILKETEIKLITFGSIPINCIDQKFIKLLKNKKFTNRISHFLHIPIQSGSDKILNLMKRPYNSKQIKKTFNKLQNIPDISFGTDIIVSFPSENKKDFQDTFDLCQQINFKKIHCFRYSPRPNTQALILFNDSPKITIQESKNRSAQIRSL
jgi:threonylcarbamoyladenosine tRNA methylthiotransferase MtaB